MTGNISAVVPWFIPIPVLLNIHVILPAVNPIAVYPYMVAAWLNRPGILDISRFRLNITGGCAGIDAESYSSQADYINNLSHFTACFSNSADFSYT